MAKENQLTAAEYQALMKKDNLGYVPKEFRPTMTEEVKGRIIQNAFTPAPGRKKPGEAEHLMQVEVVNDFRADYPEYAKLLHAIPNGAKVPYKRIKKKNGKTITVAPERAKLIAEGMKTGIPDLHLPIARGGWKSLYMELKVLPNHPSQEQLDMMHFLMQEGHLCMIIYTAETARLFFKHYLDLPKL